MKVQDLRLLIEIESFDKGGLQKMVLDSALLFQKHGIQTTIVATEYEGFLAEQGRNYGIDIVCLKDTDKAATFDNILRTKRINLSCSHFSYFGYPFYRSINIPNITFIHNVYANLRDYALKRFLDSDRYIDRYIAVSKNAERYARDKLGIPGEKIVAIGNGLIIEEHEILEKNKPPVPRERFGLKAGDYVFLNVATYNLHKGHYLMADAMKKILKQRDDIKILCIGNVVYPPHAEGFQADIKAQGLDRHISMPGYFEQTTGFYKMADAFLMPSFIEGWSIAMTEAMFYEKPMILTDTGAAPEVIENNDIGILIPNEYGDISRLDAYLLDATAYDQREFQTSQLLAEAMMEFADHRHAWKEAGKKGKQKVLARHRFDRMVSQYEDIFLEIVATSPIAHAAGLNEPLGSFPGPSVSITTTEFAQPSTTPARRFMSGFLRRVKNIRLIDGVKTVLRPLIPARCRHSLRTRWIPAVLFFLANSFFMNFPFYRLRHFFLRRFCRIKIGRDSSVLMHCYVSGPNIEIGDNTVINRYVYLDGRAMLKIGSNVNVSHYSLIQTLTHDPQNPDFVCLLRPVHIEDHVWIGARAIVLPGVTIGEGAVIGAGAVVTHDIPAYSIAVGNPARVIQQRSRLIRYRSRYFPLLNTDFQ